MPHVQCFPVENPCKPVIEVDDFRTWYGTRYDLQFRGLIIRALSCTGSSGKPKTKRAYVQFLTLPLSVCVGGNLSCEPETEQLEPRGKKSSNLQTSASTLATIRAETTHTWSSSWLHAWKTKQGRAGLQYAFPSTVMETTNLRMLKGKSMTLMDKEDGETDIPAFWSHSIIFGVMDSPCFGWMVPFHLTQNNGSCEAVHVLREGKNKSYQRIPFSALQERELSPRKVV